ncbi:MAG: hypothetical protein K0R13_2125 [Propionibacteriaceae bacterium]|nr:hypothetical protein [Propionibacteriaceae bacterium]
MHTLQRVHRVKNERLRAFLQGRQHDQGELPRAEVDHGYQPASTATISTMKKPSSPCTITPIQKLR